VQLAEFLAKEEAEDEDDTWAVLVDSGTKVWPVTCTRLVLSSARQGMI
jgi:hypothetical protein